MKKILFIIIIPSFILAFCSKKSVPEASSLLGLDYYPTTKGKYVVYDVDSVIYTDLTKDTIEYKYRIKEKIADSFTDNQGQPAIRLERYIKKYNPQKSYDSIPWTIKEVWMLNASEKSIQLQEGNVRYTKMVFPIKENESWNGNALNNLGEAIYRIEYFGRNEIINKVNVADVLLVNQKEYRTQISYEKQVEKFAKGVGLVYKEITYLLSNSINSKPVEARIENGFIYKLSFNSIGYE